MNLSNKDSERGLVMLRISAWIRRQGWLRPLYRRLPAAWTHRASAALASRTRGTLSFPELPAASPAAASPAPARHMAATSGAQGVNLIGFLRGQSGLSESARMYARALIDAGYPVALIDIEDDSSQSGSDRSLDAYIGHEAPFGVNLVFVNPDRYEAAMASLPPDISAGRRTFACWFWELETVPASWLRTLERVDGVLASSRFVRDALVRITDKPVVHVPLPLVDVDDSGLERGDFGLEASKILFLCSFDFNSWMERKNPFAVIEAFVRAFDPERDDVCLLIKAGNGHRHPAQLERLLAEASADPRILVRDEIIERAHMRALQRCCDVYVSLHRAEGFGLGMAECMLQGKPVVATGWSGNLDFMSADNSRLIDYRLVPVGADEYPHGDGARWADADVDQAASAMLELADEPALREALGARAAVDVREVLSPVRVATALAEFLISSPVFLRVATDDAANGVAGAQAKVGL
ncbi:glycosyl transferases group 1 family protein [Lysobacter antibioticus]|uniref:glycosyltransferase family 4 protein n=1 Tax=Lysobacter antibioticus TaxID=84531 RepID=UPI000720C108|nr:glycosyltransferase family 4 protein [Lysobacter antibioticus]ALN62953.1 glycosyl transferases group 1 family protein [Lysobacter antibioticus]